VGPEDHFCGAVRNDLRVPLTVEGHPRTLSGPSPDLSPAGSSMSAAALMQWAASPLETGEHGDIYAMTP
jgi:hypothetical protein